MLGLSYCAQDLSLGMQRLWLWCTASLDGAHGLSSCSARLSCPVACGILVPQPGIKLVSPTLKGGFLNPGPPGKSLDLFFSLHHIVISDLLSVFASYRGEVIKAEILLCQQRSV